jgi:hypothetical protein
MMGGTRPFARFSRASDGAPLAATRLVPDPRQEVEAEVDAALV